MLTPSDSSCQLCETSPTRCTCINNYSTFPLWWKHDNLFTFVKRMLWLSHPALSQNLSKNVEILTNNAQIIINRLGPYHSSFGFKFWARVYGGLNKTRQRNTGQLNFLNFFFIIICLSGNSHFDVDVMFSLLTIGVHFVTQWFCYLCVLHPWRIKIPKDAK